MPTVSDQLSTEAAHILKTAADLAVTMDVQFVPFSQSRNAKPSPRLDDLSLNWRVTLLRNGRAFLTTDYGAGITHCPSYRQAHTSIRNTGIDYSEAIRWECEHGTQARAFLGGLVKGGTPILPDLQDVLYSLALDASVLNYSSFEDWAPDLGIDPDSRAGEKIYRACLDIALKMRAALGDDGLSKLQTACEGY